MLGFYSHFVGLHNVQIQNSPGMVDLFIFQKSYVNLFQNNENLGLHSYL